MDIAVIIGVVATVALILGLSIYSGTRTRGGQTNGAAITAGLIMGTLVGGSSTVGTAQLAYNYGMSAWWFTLGGGISCLVLALCFVGPLRHSGGHTLIGMIENEFGPVAGLSASILNTLGTFINVISQMLAASAVLAVLFPNMGLAWELIISTVFMILYVVIGGRRGAGMVGILKLALLYIAMIGSGLIVLRLTGGVGGFTDMVRGIDDPAGVNFFSLFARGAGTDLGAGVSLLLGVLTEPGGASGVLKGITLDAARNEIIQILGRGEDSVQGKQMVYTPRTKKVLEQSVREARDLKQNYVSTEHILLALMREREGVAAHVLIKMGMDLSKARDELLRILTGADDETAPQEGANADTPILNQFSRDLTAGARSGELDPVVGRGQEIERIVQILSRRRKNNPVLIGEPGVGKSAIVEGLAQLIVEGSIPEILRGKRVVSLDLASMLAGAKYRGEFEERLKNAMGEIKKAGNVILFIDELHTICGAGASEGAIDAANILKPALARGEMQCIGATTLNEYHKHIEKDAALERRFQPVTVGEPSREESVEILKGLRDRYEAHHRVRITDEAITAAVYLSDRYISDRYLPDKAIDLIDEAASRVRIKAFTAPPDMKEQQLRLESLNKETEEAVAHEDFEKAAHLRDRKKTLQNFARFKDENSLVVFSSRI